MKLGSKGKDVDHFVDKLRSEGTGTVQYGITSIFVKGHAFFLCWIADSALYFVCSGRICEK
jgi:hypothetical protein